MNNESANFSTEEILKLSDYLKEKLDRIEKSKDIITDKNQLLPKSEVEVIHEIELQTGIIPVVDDVYYSFGVVIKDHHVVVLGLCGCNIEKVPNRIKDLQYLETLYIDLARFGYLPDQIGNLHLSPFLSQSLNYRAYWK